jgi:hypothetical protein
MDSQSFSGLGFGKRLSDQDLDSLMRSYMDQCLQYHQEQSQQPHSIPQAPTFIPSSSQCEDFIEEKVSSSIDSDGQSKESLHEGIKKAKAIAARFSNEISTVPREDASYPYAQKRFVFFQQHQQKLDNALVKNLKYLLDKDEGLLQTIQEAQKITVKQNLFRSVAGIGSKERRSVQNQLKRKGHDLSSNLNNCGVYITGLGDVDDMENVLRTLFGSYGTISTIKLYEDKVTKARKGDGLVMYDWASVRKQRIASGDDRDDPGAFISLVCSQVSIYEKFIFHDTFPSFQPLLKVDTVSFYFFHCISCKINAF